MEAFGLRFLGVKWGPTSLQTLRFKSANTAIVPTEEFLDASWLAVGRLAGLKRWGSAESALMTLGSESPGQAATGWRVDQVSIAEVNQEGLSTKPALASPVASVFKVYSSLY